MKKKILVSDSMLKLLAEGRIKPVEGKKIKLGRMVFKRKLGVFHGLKGKAEG